MSIQELLTGGGGLLVLALTVIQLAPIKVNPWSAIAKAIGRAINAEVLAVVLCVPVERAGAELPWECPLWLQAVVCAALVTLVEFVAGCVLNLWIGLDIWDYSDIPFNLLGQICLPFSLVWLVLCFLFIVVFDWMRYAVIGGDKPTYSI